MLASRYEKKLNMVDIKLDAHDFFIETENVREIYIPGHRIIPVPLASKTIVGIIDVRGTIFTVLSLKHLLYDDGETKMTDQTPILLLDRTDDANIALLVDAVDGIKNIPASAFQNSGIIIDTDIDIKYIKKVGMARTEKYLVLDINALLGMKDMTRKIKSVPTNLPNKKTPPTPSSAFSPAQPIPSLSTNDEVEDTTPSTEITFDEVQRDALQEVGNIGAGNAANALAKMINERVDINIPSVEMLAMDKFAGDFSKKREKYFVSWSNITGQTRATVLIMFKASDIVNLTTNILNEEKKPKIAMSKITKVDDFPESYRSAMIELCHILSSHYTSAIGDLLNLKLMTEPPNQSLDNGSQLIQILKDDIGISNLYSLVISTRLIVKEHKIEGKFMFIPEISTLQDLLAALANFSSGS
ncbi:MAG TPA: chemotaxis protein CheW [Candidatus Lokiarchaeia archaeon]|nr:chemotaxis protein CheW [Candidatus Lokiarchaeia archaeon]